jgi:hypothetical protein
MPVRRRARLTVEDAAGMASSRGFDGVRIVVNAPPVAVAGRGGQTLANGSTCAAIEGSPGLSSPGLLPPLAVKGQRARAGPRRRPGRGVLGMGSRHARAHQSPS